MAEKVLLNSLLKHKNNGLVDRIERRKYMNTDLTWDLFSKNVHNVISPLSCDNYGNDLVYIFVLNSTKNEIMDIDIIVNKQTYHNCNVKPNEFSLIPVSDIHNIDNMQVIHKNVVWFYDFKNDDRLKNHALFKKSFVKFVQ